MAEYITKIRTESGDMQIDYNALANLPKSDSTLSQSGKFADAKTTGDKIKKINEELNDINTDIQGVNVNIENINAELQSLMQHTHDEATQEQAGLMSAEDKEKLDNLDEYDLPEAGYEMLGGVYTTSDVTDTDGLKACPIIEGVPYYENSTLESMGVTATVEEINKLSGLYSVAEKTKATEVYLIPGNWNRDDDSGLWLYYEQVQGLFEDSIVFVAPAPDSMTVWVKYGVHCCTQRDDELCFAANSEPQESDGDIIVNVAILG